MAGSSSGWAIPKGGAATLVVAAVNSLHPERADYKCDGTADQAEILAAIAALPVGGGKIILMEGNFSIGAKILINKSQVTLSGMGYGTILTLANAVNDHVIQLGDGANPYIHIVVCDLQIRGNSGNNTGSNGIHILFHTCYCNIERCYITDCKLDGIHIVSDGTIPNGCFFINIRDCHLLLNLVNNIYTGPSCNDCFISNNSILGGAVGIYSTGYYNKIIGNIMLNVVTTGIYHTGYYSDIVDNDCEYSSEGLYIQGENNLIQGNAFTGNGTFGIRGYGAHNAFVGNTIDLCVGMGIKLVCTYCTFIGNTLKDIQGHGMEMYDLVGCVISGNTIHNVSLAANDTYFGIRLYKSSSGCFNNIVSNNNIVCDAGNKMKYGIYEQGFTTPGNGENNTYRDNVIIGAVTQQYALGASGPRPVQSVEAYIVSSTTGVLAASGNGTVSATTQIDVASGRNLQAEKTGAAAAGGSVTITGKDQFGNAVTETFTFPGGAAIHVFSKIFASIDVSGIVIAGLTAADKISVGVENKIGIDHKIFAGAVIKLFRSDIGDSVGNVEDTTYMSVALAVPITTAIRIQILSLDCLA